MLSKLKNSKAPKFNPGLNEPKIDKTNEIPGPGIYDI